MRRRPRFGIESDPSNPAPNLINMADLDRLPSMAIMAHLHEGGVDHHIRFDAPPEHVLVRLPRPAVRRWIP